MRRSWSRVGRWSVVLGLTAAVLAGTYAVTAANTVPASKAGDGAGAVSGYVLSSVHYNLNATSPGNVDSVTFTLDSAPPAGSTLKAQLDAAGSWYACTNVGTAVTCDTTAPQATVLAVTQLRVVIAQ
ncbi:MAG TPA: hypothetical protein VE669_04740 [Actinomycetota bacterium]|nr:hypothetical protein [Actinomycetota bacterium]